MDSDQNRLRGDLSPFEQRLAREADYSAKDQRIAALETELAEARKDTERLDKLERQGGPVSLAGTHIQRDGSYQTWQWRDVHGRETLRRRKVRECIDDIKEVL